MSWRFFKRTTSFIVLLFISFVTLSIMYFIASYEEQTYKEEHELQKKFETYIRNFQCKEAYPILSQLEKNEKNRAYLYKNYGECLYANQDAKSASVYYEKAIQLQPLLVKNSIFDLQYGQILFLLGEHKKSRAYLMASLTTEGQKEDREKNANLVAGAINLLLKLDLLESGQKSSKETEGKK